MKFKLFDRVKSLPSLLHDVKKSKLGKGYGLGKLRYLGPDIYILETPTEPVNEQDEVIKEIQMRQARARRFDWNVAKDFINIEEELANQMMGDLVEEIDKLTDSAKGIHHLVKRDNGETISQKMLQKLHQIRVEFNQFEI